MRLSNVSLRRRIVPEYYEYRAIRGEQPLVIRPCRPEQIQPASVDVHIGDTLKEFVGAVMHLNQPEVNAARYRTVGLEDCPLHTQCTEARYWKLYPGRLYLAESYEYFEIPPDLCGDLRGVSTNGRMGFVPHKEAGLLDPGWKGKITLEIEVSVLSFLYPIDDRGQGFRVAQVTFDQLDYPADPPYRGRYQDDLELSPAKANITLRCESEAGPSPSHPDGSSSPE